MEKIQKFVKLSKGFTLVELLVVISIIAILSTFAIGSYTNVQKNARDAKRKADLAVIQSYLEQYHADAGFYPLQINSGSPACFGGNEEFVITGSLGLTYQTKTYSQALPVDPNDACYSGNNSVYLYVPSPDNCPNLEGNYCTSYCLYAKMENPGVNDFDNPGCPAASATVTGADNYGYEVSAP